MPASSNDLRAAIATERPRINDYAQAVVRKYMGASIGQMDPHEYALAHTADAVLDFIDRIAVRVDAEAAVIDANLALERCYNEAVNPPC
jgi:hypothetical protein